VSSGRRAVPLGRGLVNVALLVAHCHSGLFVGGGRPQVGLLGFDVPMPGRPGRPSGPLDGLLGAAMGRRRHVEGG
jgi:hypothetical protein